MKVKNALLFIVLGALLLSLSGCFQVTEEYWINEKGSGKLHFEMGVSEALLAMGDSSNTVDGNQLFKNQGMDAENPYLKNVKTNQTSENGMRIYTIDADVTDFSKVFTNTAESQDGFQIQFEKLTNGNYLLKRTMDLDKLNAGKDTTMKVGDTDMSGMLGAMLADKYWTIRLHSDQVVNTNGKWDKDNHVIEWKVPISQVLTGKGKIEMTTELRMGPPILLYLAVAAAVVLIILVVIGLYLLKRSRSKSETVPPTSELPTQVS